MGKVGESKEGREEGEKTVTNNQMFTELNRKKKEKQKEEGKRKDRW